jgi:hypothetical protein
MCMVLNAGWEEGGLLVYYHRSCILPGASSRHVPDLLFICIRYYIYIGQRGKWGGEEGRGVKFTLC